MLEKFLDALKELWMGNKSSLAILRFLRCMACIILISVVFCDCCWDSLVYEKTISIPLFNDKVRSLLYSIRAIMLFLWLVYRGAFQNLYKICGMGSKIIASFIEVLLDCFFTMYFFMYAINVGMEYGSGIQVQIQAEAILSVVYLTYCTYILHKYKCEKNIQPCFTNYCDSNGQEIPIDGKVFYKGKVYKIVEYEGSYRLLPKGNKIISGKLIKLEEAASDMGGKLFVKKDI